MNDNGFEASSVLDNVGVDPAFHYKYCPRCGAAGVFHSGSSSFKCPDCGFNFFLNSAAAVTAVIFNEQGELLMVRRGVEPAKGMLDLPGGFVDPGESVETALLRELREELDIVPVSFSFYGSFPNQYLFSGTVVYTVDMVFKCRLLDFSNLKFLDDVMGIEFIKPENIDLDLLPFISVKNLIAKLRNEQKDYIKA